MAYTDKGVIFGKEYDADRETNWDFFTLTIQGNVDDYLATLRALLDLMAGGDPDFYNRDDNYLICNLIKNMLPNYEQIKLIEKSQLQAK